MARREPATLNDLGLESVREDGEDATLQETAWAVGRLTDVGLERLSTFLLDLSKRAPLGGPAWAAHTLVIESLEHDVRKERERRGG